MYKRIAEEDRPKNINSMHIAMGEWFCTSYTMDQTNPHYTIIEYMGRPSLVKIWIEGKHMDLTEEIILADILTGAEIKAVMKHIYNKGKTVGRNLTIHSLESFISRVEDNELLGTEVVAKRPGSNELIEGMLSSINSVYTIRTSNDIFDTEARPSPVIEVK